MNKKKNTPETVAELVKMFCDGTLSCYDKIISSGIYFGDDLSKEFWSEILSSYEKSSNKFLGKKSIVVGKLTLLHAFFQLKELLEEEKSKLIKEVLQVNPSKELLVKSLFLCLELGETNPEEEGYFPKYTEESLEAVKKLIQEISFQSNKTKSPRSSTYTSDLAYKLNDLLKVQIDIILVAEFLDIYVWADFDMGQLVDGKGFILSLFEDNKSKEKNRFILNCLKTQIKREYKRKDSKPLVSAEEHFKKIDPTLKTNEGLAVAFYGGGVTVNTQTEGTTSIHIENDFNMDNEEQRMNQFVEEAMKTQAKQYFHYYYRNALESIYQPNDAIDIHSLFVKINQKLYVTLHDFFCVASGITAMAHSFKYASNLSWNINQFKLFTIADNKRRGIQENVSVINQHIDSEIVNNYSQLESAQSLGQFKIFDLNIFFKHLFSIEEIKKMGEQKVYEIIKLLSHEKYNLPFNPIYEIEGGMVYFSYESCCKFNIGWELYEHYISDRLFNSSNKNNAKQTVGENQKNRETRFSDSIRDLFKSISTKVYAESGVEFGDKNTGQDFGNLKGDIDVAVYFEEENTFFLIEAKLSNTTPHREKRKKTWIEERIEKKGIGQVLKNRTLLENEKGRQFVAEKLGIDKQIDNPKIFHLIVTDNFYADHECFTYNEKEDKVLVISNFELEALILNQAIDARQNIPALEKGKEAAQLIDLIERNVFWEFLQEDIKNFKMSKSLSAIEKKFSIRLHVE